MDPRLFTFIGGKTGPWRIASVKTIIGEPLAGAARLNVTPGSIVPEPIGTKWLLRGMTSNERYLTSEEKQLLAAKEPVVIQFTPHLIPVNRGILSTLYLAPEQHFATLPEMNALAEQIAACYSSAYGNEPFVRLVDGSVLRIHPAVSSLAKPSLRLVQAKALPDTKNVVGTNVIEIGWRLDARTGRLIVMSAVDNIVKGASGQAVQCMNILCGFDETAGLI